MVISFLQPLSPLVLPPAGELSLVLLISSPLTAVFEDAGAGAGAGAGDTDNGGGGGGDDDEIILGSGNGNKLLRSPTPPLLRSCFASTS